MKFIFLIQVLHGFYQNCLSHHLKSPSKNNGLRFWRIFPQFIIKTVFKKRMCLFKANVRNTKKVLENCSKSTMKAPEGRQWGRSCIFIINFEQIPHIVLVFPLSILTKQMPAENHEAPLTVAPTERSFEVRFSKSLEKWKYLVIYVFQIFFVKNIRRCMSHHCQLHSLWSW